MIDIQKEIEKKFPNMNKKDNFLKKSLFKIAKKIVHEYNGIFPNNFEELVSLPGVGPYTAQAILSFGFNQNILAFDTNIEKIFCRYYF